MTPRANKQYFLNRILCYVQDFCEAYERVQEESLSTMTRDDLVREHMALERTLSYLQVG